MEDTNTAAEALVLDLEGGGVAAGRGHRAPSLSGRARRGRRGAAGARRPALRQQQRAQPLRVGLGDEAALRGRDREHARQLERGQLRGRAR